MKPDPIFGKAELDTTERDYKTNYFHRATGYVTELNDQTQEEHGYIAQNFEDTKKLTFYDDIRRKYFDMKWEWYRHKNIKQFGTINKEIESKIKYREDKEGPLMRRLEYMYQRYDYDNDIEKVRNRMFNQELKRASV